MTSPWLLPLRMTALLLWIVGQIVITSARVGVLILTPGRHPQPGIVRVEFDDLSETELTLLLGLITITPDTLVIAVDRSENAMFVHGMFVAGDPEGFRTAILRMHERLLRGVRLRPPALRARKEQS